MAWQLKGSLVIACNCDWGCPCNFNALPTRGHCEGGWIWSIAEGRVEDVVLDGLAMALFAAWPGAIHEGGGRATGFVDDRADDAQRDALTRLLSGSIGGPWSIFINTYQLDAPTSVRFDLKLNAYDTRIVVGDAVHLELTPMRNPVTGVEVHPSVALPEGLVTKGVALAASKTFRASCDVVWDHSGQYAAFGPFEYAS